MHRSNIILTAVAALAFGTQAHAYIYVGNPVLTLKLDRVPGDITAGDATIDGVRVHTCGGGYVDFVLDDVADLAAGWSTTVDSGDLCGVSVDWGSSVDATNGSWAVAYDEPTTSFTLDGNPAQVSVGLTPFSVVSGTWSGPPVLLTLTLTD